jgi:hypothetical protein
LILGRSYVVEITDDEYVVRDPHRDEPVLRIPISDPDAHEKLLTAIEGLANF